MLKKISYFYTFYRFTLHFVNSVSYTHLTLPTNSLV